MAHIFMLGEKEVCLRMALGKRGRKKNIQVVISDVLEEIDVSDVTSLKVCVFVLVFG